VTEKTLQALRQQIEFMQRARDREQLERGFADATWEALRKRVRELEASDDDE
jgi:hypothetical protein